ncbi:hypothetical protein P154DRAFT_524809 [Amniculicola lignicola CBS 123094]|uniref:Uncharacterized protein n=1 Tax=Amniculicola lignicola CBS 123094 TaxID=1392246 RepID=A0A6A5W6S5_9PLEO|nr:hypothetical protein P154DRAFT_524809 [Amniculicola lignicola CBS 123094]
MREISPVQFVGNAVPYALALPNNNPSFDSVAEYCSTQSCGIVSYYAVSCRVVPVSYPIFPEL